MKRIELKNGNYKEIIYYDTEETIIYREYYHNSKDEYNRLNGPAEIWYYSSGEIESEDYIINNKYYTKEEFYKIININRNLKLLNKK